MVASGEETTGLVLVLFKHSHALWPASSKADPPLFFPLGRERLFANPPTLFESISKIRQRRLVPICKGSRSQTSRVQRWVLEFASVAPKLLSREGQKQGGDAFSSEARSGPPSESQNTNPTSNMFHDPAPLMVGGRSKRCGSRAVLALRKVDSCRYGLRQEQRLENGWIGCIPVTGEELTGVATMARGTYVQYTD